MTLSHDPREAYARPDRRALPHPCSHPQPSREAALAEKPLHSGSSPSAITVVIPAFHDFWAPREATAIEIIGLCTLPPGMELAGKRLLEIMRACAAFVFVTPASEYSHDHHPGGLVDHTLEVCFQALMEAQSRPDWVFQDRVALLMLCLGHDLGRIRQIAVTAEGDFDMLTWTPDDSSMADWCELHQLSSITLTWIPGRPGVGAHAIEPLGLHYLNRVCPISLLTLLGTARYNALHDAFGRRIGIPVVDYHEIFKRADRFCAAARTPEVPHPPLVQAFVLALREGIQIRPEIVNTSHADVYVSPTHTIMSLPHTSTNYGQVWSYACASLSERADVESASWLSKRLLQDATAPFLRWPGSESCESRAKQMVLRSSQPDMLAVTISNADLWGDELNCYDIQPFAGPLRFVRPTDLPSFTAEQLGFDSDSSEDTMLQIVGNMYMHLEEIPNPRNQHINDAILATGRIPKEDLMTGLRCIHGFVMNAIPKFRIPLPADPDDL